MTTEDQPHYDAGDITVLEGLEAVRKRPGMYIGSHLVNGGLHHLVLRRSSTTQSMRRWPATATYIEVTILRLTAESRSPMTGAECRWRCTPLRDKPTVEVILTILHAGGKFGGGGYAVAGGLHGVGIDSGQCALSNALTVEVRRDGYMWTMNFVRVCPPVSCSRGEETEETGTMVTFWPDSTIFETTDFSYRIPACPLPADGVPQQGYEDQPDR